MNKNLVLGLLGIVIGSAWLLNNFQYFDEQGVTAIGMPALILIAGATYLVTGLKPKEEE